MNLATVSHKCSPYTLEDSRFMEKKKKFPRCHKYSKNECLMHFLTIPASFNIIVWLRFSASRKKAFSVNQFSSVLSEL